MDISMLASADAIDDRNSTFPPVNAARASASTTCGRLYHGLGEAKQPALGVTGGCSGVPLHGTSRNRLGAPLAGLGCNRESTGT